MQHLESLKLGRALGLLMRTTPILLVRLGVYLAFWAICLIYLGAVGGVAWLLGNVWEPLGFIIFIAALISIAPIYQLAYRYVFYVLKAAFIAIVSELIVHGELPDNQGQLAWGRKAVEERFGQVSAMFLIDELVEGAVRAFTMTVYSVMTILPGETFRNLANVVNRVVRFAMRYIDEAILARSFWRKEQSVWTSASDGVVLYAQVWQPILVNAVVLMLLSYVPFLVTLIVFSAPIGFLVAGIFGSNAGGWTVLMILLLAYLVKVAVGDAFAMTAIIAAYHDATQDLDPNAEMSARLESLSDQFRELKGRAEEAVRGSASPGGDTPPPDVSPAT